ncbi:Alpha-soluble NSF attachment protein 2 [Tetrabaena socialis]|uniref:Alpha-soluble NSF attachment protein 2 n=1 Tax=Tetrabaena socialis TaxID=47790 RepID=A0A2J7ZZ64_9CHLO|nr:Alpha-soluble NSF attachment protein 2 [Tetrabaena socialis]|eukprot:PNH05536.1 Alpha-soluble NSF attachment protein 2 [Tetrabaena socialis]
MSDYAGKAEEYRKQAEKKLKSLLGGLFGNKNEEAAELLEKAANNYKLAKMYNECSEMYEKLAGCHIKMDSKHEAATSYVEAAKALAKHNPPKSQQLLQQAVNLYTDMGRLNMAARQLREIAEQNEKAGQKEEAIQFYNQAADLFEMEGSNSDATKCKLKVAEFSAEMGRYSKAVELFEDAARRAVENNLLKYSARGYLLQAGVCCLCYLRPDDVANKLDKYRGIDLQFDGSREANLLDGLVEARRELDEAKFATLLAEFDSVTRLDAWKVKILREAKRKIEEEQLGVGAAGEGGGGSEDDEEDLL